MWENERLLDTTIVSGQLSFVLMLFCTSDIERELEPRVREDCRGRLQQRGRPLAQDPLVRRDTKGRVFEFFTFHFQAYIPLHIVREF